MAVNLQSLLQIANSGKFPGTPGYGDGIPQSGVPLPPVEGEDITVTGSPPRAPVVANPALNIPLEPLQASPEQIRAMQPLEGLPKHKGLFGVKGTLRDVLGIIGDSLLVGSGRDAIYGPHKQRERISDAMVGFTGNPKDQLAAIQRVAAVDPVAAQKMWDQYNDQQNKIDDREVQTKRYEAQATRDAAKLQTQKLKIAQVWAANTQDPLVLEQIKQWVQDPSATLDEIPNEVLAASAITPYQKATIDYRDRNLGERGRHNRATESIGQQNAQSNRIRANKAGSSGRNPTNASLGAALVNKMERVGWNGLTKGQQDKLRSLNLAPEPKGNRRPPPGKTAPTKSTSSGGGWGKMTVK